MQLGLPAFELVRRCGQVNACDSEVQAVAQQERVVQATWKAKHNSCSIQSRRGTAASGRIANPNHVYSSRLQDGTQSSTACWAHSVARLAGSAGQRLATMPYCTSTICLHAAVLQFSEMEPHSKSSRLRVIAMMPALKQATKGTSRPQHAALTRAGAFKRSAPLSTRKQVGCSSG